MSRLDSKLCIESDILMLSYQYVSNNLYKQNTKNINNIMVESLPLIYLEEVIMNSILSNKINTKSLPASLVFPFSILINLMKNHHHSNYKSEIHLRVHRH